MSNEFFEISGLKSISKALFDSGIKDYIRSYSIISSKLTNPVEAFLLKCKQGEPCLLYTSPSPRD